MIQMTTMESEHFLATAYEAAGGMRMMICMTGEGACASGGRTLATQLADELREIGTGMRLAYGCVLHLKSECDGCGECEAARRRLWRSEEAEA